MAAVWLLQALYHSLLTAAINDDKAGNVSPLTHVLANTTLGTVSGAVDVRGQAVPIARFLGLPYAQPPTGSLRFKAPLPAASWAGVRDASTFGPECIQVDAPLYSFPYGPYTRSEDCLYLNVYTPATGPATPLPVMVWIHGGGYTIGTGNMYDGSSLAAKGVVLVTINYRLDAFGFLSTEDDVMPGNYGMLDQVLALKWVKDNIAAFGGNPDMVTIFGESAGSSSVALLNLSPMATGLYRRSIMESGQALTLWGSSYPGEKVNPRTYARLVATAMGCTNLDDSNALLGCLQSKDPNQLLDVSLRVVSALAVGIVTKPRVDGPAGFLPASPPHLLAQGRVNHVDTLRGFNADELGGLLAPGLVYSPVSPANLSLIVQFQSAAFTDLDAIQLRDHILSSSIPPSLTGDGLQKAVADAVEDIFFVGPCITEIQEVSSRVADRNHFLYQFDHKPSRVADANKTPSWVSAIHGDEIQFVFNVSLKMFTETFSGQQPSADDVTVSVQMMDMWTNFAKTGDPTATIPPGATAWQAFSVGQQNILHINTTSTLSQWSRPGIVGFYQEFLKLADGDDAVAGFGVVG